MNLDDWERETLPLPFGLDLLHGGAHEECEGSAVVGPTYPDRVAAGIVTLTVAMPWYCHGSRHTETHRSNVWKR
jgi:hypothetical protein